LKALGKGGGAIGYGGLGDALDIDSSVAIRFDTFAKEWDVVGDINGSARTHG
jgi:hypothetical protein